MLGKCRSDIDAHASPGGFPLDNQLIWNAKPIWMLTTLESPHSSVLETGTPTSDAVSNPASLDEPSRIPSLIRLGHPLGSQPHSHASQPHRL